ncbi:MAG TPA: hypothetical protein VG897_04725 [Terriglobales bacterium]|nr:hypothetical protein [Terriglobales bacterium]
MRSRPIVLETLIADLRRVEIWLTESLGVSVETPERSETPDPFAPADDLAHLKDAIDRIRPLLWVFLSRENETRELNRRRTPSSVRSLMDDALNISDRHIREGD